MHVENNTEKLNKETQNKLSKEVLITWLFVTLMPFLDILTYFFKFIPLSIGALVKGIFILVVIFILLFNKSKERSMTILLVIIGIVYAGVYLLRGELTLGLINDFLKWYYMFFFYTWLKYLKDKHNYSFSVRDFMFPTLFVLVTYILASITNTGVHSYSWTAGHSGWFYSGNEFSALISLLAIAFTYVLFSARHKLTKYILLAAVIIMSLSVGTKVPPFMIFPWFICTLIYGIIQYIHNKKKKNKDKSNGYKFLTIFAIFAIVFTIVAFPLSHVGSRTDLAKKISTYFSEMREENPHENIEKPEDGEDNKSILIKKDSELLRKLLGGRAEKLEEYSGLISKARSDWSYKIFGYGRLQGHEIQVEIDFFTIFYAHGLLGVVMTILLLLFVLIDIINKFKHNKTEYLWLDLSLLYIYIMFILVSIFAGHILVAPSVYIYLLTILSVEEKPLLKEDYLVYDLEGKGFHKISNLDVLSNNKLIASEFFNAVDKTKDNNDFIELVKTQADVVVAHNNLDGHQKFIIVMTKLFGRDTILIKDFKEDKKLFEKVFIDKVFYLD